MRKSIAAVVALVALAAAAALPTSSGAAVTQQARVSLGALTGSLKPKGYSYARIDAYLATRDSASLRPQMEANPVGRIVMSFPTGTVLNSRATSGCRMNQYSPVSALKSMCASSQIGTGWALVNTATPDATPRAQIPDLGGFPNSPGACGIADATQYSRTWAGGTLDCVPIGHLWNRVRAYQGAIVGGVYTPNAVIFANENAVSGLAFAGTVKANVLTVQLPALNGTGSGAGELPFGWVLSDFRLVINRSNYLKTPGCPGSTHRWSVRTVVSYSRFKAESGSALPAPKTISTASPCR